MFVTLYNKNTGEQREAYPVDAREIIKLGEWSFDLPADVVPVKSTSKSEAGEETKKSPLRLVPNLTAKGEAFLIGFGIQTLEELGRTPYHKLQIMPAFKELAEEDRTPIQEYIFAANSSSDTKFSVGSPGRKPGKADVTAK